ncbi:MAG: hypothetical protein COV75_03925 [Candidatus Omnitrophica bacterium CG11_big_fil_rev_8_21_14_0_20_63_9]|nr:MAG: hypothetical protein COV75_03925 [Candidatus Omnitrophica bacterium CG11_big_fil_rev_8_21_14_0_20_63_9]
MTRPHGFTLLELVIVTVVITILLSVTIPRFHHTTTRLRVEQAAFECAQLLRTAHARAVAESHQVVWVWDGTARRIQLYDVRSTAGERLVGAPVGERLSASVPIDDSVEILVVRDEQALSCSEAGDPTGCSACSCIHFAPDGTAEDGTAAPVIVRLVSERRTYTVTVDAPTSQVALLSRPAAP